MTHPITGASDGASVMLGKDSTTKNTKPLTEPHYVEHYEYTGVLVTPGKATDEKEEVLDLMPFK